MTAEPSADSSGVSVAEPLYWPGAELGRWSIGTLLALLWCTAVLVGWRRLAGALSNPLDPPWLLFVAALVVMVAAGVRVMWQRVPRRTKTARLDLLVTIVPSAALICLGAAVSLPGTHTGGLVALWALVVAEEVWAWWPVRWRRRHGRDVPRSGRTLRMDEAQKPTPHGSATEPLLSTPIALPLATASDELLQQLTRTQAADGSEQLWGWLRTSFAAGQRTASIHVAFCPPFAKTPQLTVAQLDGPSTRIKEAQLLPHGARLDLKLATAAENPDSVLLQFSARSTGAEVDGGQ